MLVLLKYATDPYFQIYCTHIFVGVPGAGLEWLYFLPPHSAVIEFGWHRFPAGFYTRKAKSWGLLAKSLSATSPEINWKTYSEYNRIDNLTETIKKQRLSGHEAWWLNTNPYKFADAHVDVITVVNTIKGIIKQLSKKGVIF